MLRCERGDSNLEAMKLAKGDEARNYRSLLGRNGSSGRVRQKPAVSFTGNRIREGGEGRRTFTGDVRVKNASGEERAHRRLVIAVAGMQRQIGPFRKGQIPGLAYEGHLDVGGIGHLLIDFLGSLPFTGHAPASPF